MSDLSTVLPSHSTGIEIALEGAAIDLFSGIDLESTWDPSTLRADLLPWLAWSLSVDEWDGEWADDRKRQVVADSLSIHRQKGTIGSIQKAIKSFGFNDASIIEGFQSFKYDAALTYDATETHGQQEHWAQYRVFLSRPITIEQSTLLKRILASVAPARSELLELSFVEAANLYDSKIAHDGAFTYGAA